MSPRLSNTGVLKYILVNLSPKSHRIYILKGIKSVVQAVRAAATGDTDCRTKQRQVLLATVQKSEIRFALLFFDWRAIMDESGHWELTVSIPKRKAG